MTQHAVVKWMEANPERVRPHLPEGWTPEVAKRQTLALLQADKAAGGKIAKCDPQSLTLAVLQAASYGLDLSTSDAYIIPYGREATLSIGWQGMVKLAKRGGEIRDIEAEVVLRGEDCVVQRSSDGSRHGIMHSIPLERARVEPDAVVGAYCIITLADGGRTFEYVSRHDIEEARNASKSSNSPAWRNWFGEMAKKFCIRRALKRFSLTPESAQAVAEDMRRHVGQAVVTGSRVTTDDLNSQLGLTHDPAPSQEPPSPEPEKSGAQSSGGGGSSPLKSAQALVQHADVGDDVKAAAKAALKDLQDESVVEWVEALQHDRVGSTHQLAEMAGKGE